MLRIEVGLDDIPTDIPFRLEHNGSAIVVVRTCNKITAFQDSCPHAQWRLSEGELVDGVIKCPGHGWGFDAATGRCLEVPAYCLKSLSVEVLANSVRFEWEQLDP
jgi:nitrite reductase/ring-hydroxylating ferredoxin subunit